MKKTTIDDCRIVELGRHHGATGNLTVVENGKVERFDTKRVFFIYDIPAGVSRGGHSHKTLRELIVAASGSFEVYVNDGKNEKSFTLNNPSKALLLPAGVWEELRNFSSGAVALVLASIPYRPTDYIRDFQEFIKYKEE
ncbi:MAG: WxcM-like domain-containing protein [Bacteroidaceae bacterium]|nr:WxcM-like domain-containing protein [Bacteroidaceae bacterium]